jgi:hypothetical protein
VNHADVDGVWQRGSDGVKVVMRDVHSKASLVLEVDEVDVLANLNEPRLSDDVLLDGGEEPPFNWTVEDGKEMGKETSGES